MMAGILSFYQQQNLWPGNFRPESPEDNLESAYALKLMQVSDEHGSYSGRKSTMLDRM